MKTFVFKYRYTKLIKIQIQCYNSCKIIKIHAKKYTIYDLNCIFKQTVVCFGHAITVMTFDTK